VLGSLCSVLHPYSRGLTKPSTAFVDHVRAVDKARIKSVIAPLPREGDAARRRSIRGDEIVKVQRREGHKIISTTLKLRTPNLRERSSKLLCVGSMAWRGLSPQGSTNEGERGRRTLSARYVVRYLLGGSATGMHLPRRRG
jgi:hypothetical protein